VAFKSLVCHLGLTTKPLLSAKSSILFCFLLDAAKQLGFVAREVIAVETDVNIALLATLAKAERRASVASFTSLLAHKPRVGVRKEVQSFAKLRVAEPRCRVWHPMLESVGVDQFG